MINHDHLNFFHFYTAQTLTKVEVKEAAEEEEGGGGEEEEEQEEGGGGRGGGGRKNNQTLNMLLYRLA